jgi:Uma2 family endonuclease
MGSTGEAMSTKTPVTADQLLRMPDDGHRYELVAGELRKMVPAGWKHGAVGGNLQFLLARHVNEKSLGQVFLADTGFLIARDPDTVRAPDIAFLSQNRLSGPEPEEAFWPGAPDLAVEVVSPGDTTGEVDEKVQAWLDAGAAMVWVVNPRWRSVTVYRSTSDIKTLTEEDELGGEDVVPGFHCRVGDIFGGT